MKNTTTIVDIFQTFLTDEEVKKVSESLRYADTARKLTLYDLVKFFIASATNEYKNYRHGVENMEDDGSIGEDLVDINSILVEDRAYGKHQRFDMFKEIKQSFIIKINIIISHSRKLKIFTE